MIIYGYESTERHTTYVSGECPACGNDYATQLTIFMKYAHVFWLPFFPLGKIGITHCQECDYESEVKHMPPEFITAYDKVKASIRPPAWMFAGIVLVVVAILVGTIGSMFNDAQNAQYVQNPQKGDCYEIRLEKDEYTLYKVAKVQEEWVFIQVNEYKTDGIEGVAALYQRSFAEKAIPLPKKRIQEMYEEGVIRNVQRE